MKKVKFSAPGKIILSGEHSVVYGHPAILTSINKRLSVQIEENRNGLEVIPPFAHGFVKRGIRTIEKTIGRKIPRNLQIEFRSNIPIGKGMGSSAAAAVALTAAIFKHIGTDLNLENINDIAYEMEKIHHGNPSGGDNTISTHGGFLWFRKESQKLKIFSRIDIEKKIPKLFYIDTGKPKESTKDMVLLVAETYRKYPKKIEKIMLEMEKVTKSFLKYLLGEEKISFTYLLKENEHLLEKLGVVSNSTQKLIRKIENIGGAAKISGAGGRSGASGILLCYHPNPTRLKAFAKRQDIKISKLILGKKGVKDEKG